MQQDRVISLGCRLNAYEAELMRAELNRNDNIIQNSDIKIVNSCAVTNEAVRQTRQTIRKLRKAHPQAKIVVTGCAVQIDPKAFMEMPEVDQIIGNREKLQSGIFKRDEKAIIGDIMQADPSIAPPPLLPKFAGKARAFIEVQNGCDHRCTFCIIPYGRGNSRSLAPGQIIEQIKILVQNGVQEIVLSGVDMTAYGRDLPIDGSLGDLVEKIIKLVPDLPRLRLSSMDCSEIDDKLQALLIGETRIQPYIHLSLQSGDEMILKRMKRRHHPDDAVRLVEDLRAKRPELVFGADMIAGFPTESDEMFENSLNHLERLGIIWLHGFSYSAKKGTPAARIPKQIPLKVRKARLQQLKACAAKHEKAYLESLIGKSEMVLFEQSAIGHSPGFAKVRLQTPDLAYSNQLLKVEYVGLDDKNHLLCKQMIKTA